MTLLKMLIIGAFGGVLISLGRALYCLIHDKEGSARTVKALTWRIGLSIALFLFVLAAYAMGWISPNSMIQV